MAEALHLLLLFISTINTALLDKASTEFLTSEKKESELTEDFFSLLKVLSANGMGEKIRKTALMDTRPHAQQQSLCFHRLTR